MVLCSPERWEALTLAACGKQFILQVKSARRIKRTITMHKENIMSFANRIRNNWTKIAATALVVFGVMSPMAVSAMTLSECTALSSSSHPRDCSTNSIVYGGAYSKSELMNSIAKGDGHNSA